MPPNILARKDADRCLALWHADSTCALSTIAAKFGGQRSSERSSAGNLGVTYKFPDGSHISLFKGANPHGIG